MGRILYLFILAFLILSGSAISQNKTSDLRLIDILALEEITEETIALTRTGVISPDASMIAWDTFAELCVYLIKPETTNCTTHPESVRLAVDHLVWSPDSTVLAIEEPVFVRMQDGDLWLFDVEDREFVNRTDDGSEGGIVLSEPSDGPVPLLDIVPTWDHSTSDLYFVRVNPDEDPRTIGLYRLAADEIMIDTEPELLIDLTGLTEDMWGSIFNTSHYSLDGAMVISPDSSKTAFLVRGRRFDDPNNGVWILDLETGEVETIIRRSELLSKGLPDWAQRDAYIEDGLSWAENGLIVTMGNFTRTSQFGWISYFIDTESGEVAPLVDYTGIADPQEYISRDETGGLVATQYGIVGPDGERFIYTNAQPNLADASVVWSIMVPPDGSTPKQISPRLNLDDLRPEFTLRASYGIDDDTLRVLMGSFLYTFEIVSSENP